MHDKNVAHATTALPGLQRDGPAVSARVSGLRSARTIGLASLVSRLLGFFRITLLVYAIGGTSSSVGGQTFDVANSIPTNLYGLIAGGVLGAVLVPQILKAVLEGAEGQARIDRLLTVTVGGAMVVAVVATFAAPVLVFIYASGWSQAWLKLASTMAYWCLPQIGFYVIYAVLAQVLNARGIFGWPAWAPAVANAISIVGVISFMVFLPSGLGGVSSWTPTMIGVLCGSSTLSIAAQALVLFSPLRRVGFSFRVRFGFSGLGAVGRVALWTFFGVAVGQLSFLALSNVATRAGESQHALGIDGPGLNSFGYAYLLMFLPHGIATVSLATATFPRLSKFAAQHDSAAVAESVMRTSATVAIICCGASAVLFAEAPLITEVLWNTAVIGQVLRPLSVGLIGLSLTYVLSRALFAYHDGRGPFLAQMIAATVSGLGALLSAILLPPQLIVVGIAISVSLSNLLAWSVAHVALKRRLRHEAGVAVLLFIPRRSVIVLTLSTALAIAAGWLVSLWLGNTASLGLVERAADLLLVTVIVTSTFVATLLMLDRRHTVDSFLDARSTI